MSVIKHPKLDKLEAAAAEALKASLSEQQLFSVAPFDEEEVERTGSSDYSYWRSTLRAFRHNWVAMLLLVLLVLILLFTFIQPCLPGQFSPTAVANGENQKLADHRHQRGGDRGAHRHPDGRAVGLCAAAGFSLHRAVQYH